MLDHFLTIDKNIIFLCKSRLDPNNWKSSYIDINCCKRSKYQQNQFPTFLPMHEINNGWKWANKNNN